MMSWLNQIFLYLKKILDKYLENNGKHFIYLSSGAVYGSKKSLKNQRKLM